MNVSQLAVALPAHILAVFAHPIRITDARIFGDRFHDNSPRLFDTGSLIDGKLDFLIRAIGQALEVVLAFQQRLAVNRNEPLARFDEQIGPGQRRRPVGKGYSPW